VLEITLTWVSGYRRSHRGRDNAPFIRSITHAPDQTYIRLQHLHCLFDLASSPPFWIIAWIETIFMEFRGPKAPVNLHGSRHLGDVLRPGLILDHGQLGSNGRRKQGIPPPTIRLLRGNDRHRKHATPKTFAEPSAQPPDSSTCYLGSLCIPK
jgi:hypothetical protein